MNFNFIKQIKASNLKLQLELSAEKQKTNDLKLLANCIKEEPMESDNELINNEIFNQQYRINELKNQLERNNPLLENKRDEKDKLKENKENVNQIKVINSIIFQ